MGFVSWVSNLLGLDSNRPAAGAVANKTEPDEIEGLNFRTAVDAHQIWKNRLHNFITGKSQEKLDANIIARPDKCVLGKWMTQIGDERYSGEKLYQNLQTAHAQFHHNASLVLTTAQSGNQKLALQMLERGDYQVSALRVVSLLARLYHRCQDGTI